MSVRLSAAFVCGHAVRFELRQHEAIDVVLDPGFVLHCRRRRLRDRLERPVILAVAAVGHGIAGGPRRARIRRAHAHPGHEIVHLRRRELSPSGGICSSASV